MAAEGRWPRAVYERIRVVCARGQDRFQALASDGSGPCQCVPAELRGTTRANARAAIQTEPISCGPAGPCPHYANGSKLCHILPAN